MSHSRIFLIIGSVLVLTIFSGCGKNTTTPTNTAATLNTAPAIDTNVDASNANIDTTAEKTVSGQVFIKSYNTPSESYGVLLADGQEIGMNAYDTMKEELRPYVGDTVTVTFSKVCKPSIADCCRTVFEKCGFVKSWKPEKKQ